MGLSSRCVYVLRPCCVFSLLVLSALSAESSPQFFNITTLKTYSLVSPGAPPPPPSSGDAVATTGAAATAPDSSASATDLSGQSAGAPGAYGSRHPSQLLGKPSGEGHWATPAPHSGIELPYVPYKFLAQVRHTYEVNHRPQSDAIASATTAEEAAAAARLRESIQTKKISEVYSEEGYEDSAYDHAGFKKDAGFSEGHEAHEGARKKKGKIDVDGGISEAETTSEDQKYPFHKVASSDAVPILSPLRYALNPASGAIPPKTEGGTEFYDSTDEVECPVVVQLPSIPGRKLSGPPSEEDEADEEGEASEDAEKSEKTPKPAPTPPPPPTPRLSGLGDKIDCLRRKYFGGDEPLDNPLFKEQVINVAKNEIGKVKAEAESIKKEAIEEEKGEESKENPVVEVEKAENVDGKAEEPEATVTVTETAGEDRVGTDSDDSSTSGVGAAVEGLPSGSASDADMQGFYADIMGHIRSATGNIVRQAYSGGREGSNSDQRSSRVKPPKTPKPPIVGFFPTEGMTGVEYPSVLPAPATVTYRHYNGADDGHGHSHSQDSEEDDEEYAGSDRDEEEEESEDDEDGHHHHHHHGHPNFLGGKKKPAAAYLLRPLQSAQNQQEAPFRPSPLLYIHNPNAQRATAPSTSNLNLHSGQSGGDSYHVPRPAQHHPHSYAPNSISSYHPSGGVRTFLVPAGKRPAPYPPSTYHYRTGPIGGIRGSGTVLLPAPIRHHPKPVYPNGGILFTTRRPPLGNSLKRQLPAGHEFDGLLTATTQTASLASPPAGFGRPYGTQPLQDLVSSPSIMAHSVNSPRNIEYFTSKDSLPPRKPAYDDQHYPSLISQSMISQITFTTTERNNPYAHVADPATATTSKEYENVGVGVATLKNESPDSLTSASESIPVQRHEKFAEESMETSDSSVDGTVKGSGRNTKDVAQGSSVGLHAAAVPLGVSPRLVTEQVTKGIVRAAIEEAGRKRKKNLDEVVTTSPAPVETDGKTRGGGRRRKNRINSRGSQRPSEESELRSEEDLDASREEVGRGGVEGVRGSKDSSRTVDSRRERIRRGEKSSSRTRIGLAAGEEEPRIRMRIPRGRKRGEPGYNTPAEDEGSTGDKIAERSELAEVYQQQPSTAERLSTAEERVGAIPMESRVSQSTLRQRNSGVNARGQSDGQNDGKIVEAAEEKPAEQTESVDVLEAQISGEGVEVPRKAFIEPKIRGALRPKIPKKSMTKPRVVPVQNKTKQELNSNDGSGRSETRARNGTSGPNQAVKRWEASKGRIISSLEEIADNSRRNARQREPTMVRRSTTIRPIIVVETSDVNNPKNQRVIRHREVKETYTSLYAPEDEV